MKRFGLIASMALTLCAGTLSADAHGRWGGGGFWPFWSFGLGWGLGAAYSFPEYSYWRSYPAYGYYYPPPVYTYSAPATYSPPAAAPQPALPPPEPPVWVPSSPGPGKWVPDPQPYRYLPTTSAQPVKPANPANPQTVTVTNSAGGVPVHISQ